MKYNLIQSFKSDIWVVITLFIGFLIILILDLPFNFLTAFITCLSVYIINDILKKSLESTRKNRIKSNE